MLYVWINLVFMLFIILVSANLFSNALEYFGEKIGLSNGVTGSILAAISTALPETMIPVIAIIAGSEDKSINEQIGVGAILGAPLMLSTLSTSIMAISVLKKRGFLGRISPEITGFNRDINFFLISFSIAAVAMFLPLKPLFSRYILSSLLVILYILYIFLTFKSSNELVKNGENVITTEPLLFSKILKFNTNLKTILFQLIVGLLLLIFGAKGFINGIHSVSNAIGISALILSLLIIPIATELPEKVNSVIWVRKNKDTLGFGNITGAMVFQGTLLPALGILLTPWQANKTVLTGIIFTLVAALWLKLNSSIQGPRILALLFNGFIYLAYIGFIFVF